MPSPSKWKPERYLDNTGKSDSFHFKGRVDSDTFFSSIQSIRGYKCVQLFVHVPSDYLFVRCMLRESHSHGAYQDFVREIGAPEIVATDNSQTQTGKKWEETSRKNVTK